MPDPVTGVGAGLGLIGSSITADAASDAASSQADAAAKAAEAAAFRPVGVTTRFGRSGYNFDPTGKLIGAGYQVSPDLAAMREGLVGLAGGSLGQAQNMAQMQPWFNQQASNIANLGTQYLSTTPQQAAQTWMTQQQGLLAPGREQQLAKVRNDLQQTGRAGLSFGATEAGGRAATNPEMAAYYNSLAQQDAQLASQADAYGRERTNYGIGLLGSGVNLTQQGFGLQQEALKPWQSFLNAANTVEGMGQGSLDLATALGAQQSTAGANQGRYLSSTGGQYTGSALGSGLMGLANNKQFTSGLGNWLSGTGGVQANVGGYTPSWGTDGSAYNPSANLYAY